MNNKLYRTKEAAQYLGVSRSSLINWIRQGLIPGGATPGGHYRFTQEQLDSFARSRGLRLAETDDAKEAPPHEEDPVRILLVDDDPAFHEIIAEALEIFQGYELKCASDGMQGAMLVGAWKPDLIILDVRMPHMNGEELLKLIRDNPDTGDAPVIVASAHLSEDLIARLEAGRANVVLEKPVRIAKLIAAIQKQIGLPLA